MSSHENTLTQREAPSSALSSPKTKDSPQSANPTTPQKADRPRHQLKRSLTDFASPTKLQRNQGHQQISSRESNGVVTGRSGQHHLHLHRGSLHLKKHHHYDEKPSHTGAHPLGPLRHSIDMARPDVVTPAITPNQSRRPSFALPNTGKRPGRTDPDEKELRIEQEAVVSQTEGLRQALRDITTFSTTMTKQLDDSYYSVLEKMSSLQTTINALAELAANSQDICTTFDKDSQGLEHDIVTKLSSIGYFNDQQAKIEQLQGRINSGRDKIRTLTERVDVLKDRIEGWDHADKEWQAKTRKRLKAVWAIIGTITVLIVAIIVGLRFAPPHTVPGLTEDVIQDVAASMDKVANQAETMMDGITEPLRKPKKGIAPLLEGDLGINTTLNWKMPAEDKRNEDRLRAFDEL